MTTKNLPFKIILSFLFLFQSILLFAYEIDIKADSLEYAQEFDRVKASGNVYIAWSDRYMYADEIEFIFTDNSIRAKGNVELFENGSMLYADEITYFYDDEKGELVQTKIVSNFAFMQAQKMERINNNNFLAKKITISNCDLDDPHTSFRAGSAKLEMNKKLKLYNVLVYINKVPVFYLPYLSRDLERGYEPFTISVEPGYSQEGGVFVKTTMSYFINEHLKHNILLDYMGKYGVGYGSQFDYFSSKTQASLYAYAINDQIVDKERWAVNPYVYSRLSDQWTLQSQLEFFSDPDFNNIYNRANWNRLASAPHSYAAFTRMGGYSSLMLLAEEYKQYNVEEDKFETQSQSVPQVAFDLYPRKLFFNISNFFSSNLQHLAKHYTPDGDLFFKNIASFSQKIEKSLPVGKNITLTPSLGVGGDFEDKNDLGLEQHSAYLNYSGGLNARLRLSRQMNWNFNYSASAITDNNSTEIDTNRDDYGLTKGGVEFTNYYYLNTFAVLRNVISYDLRNFRTTGHVRLSPLENELTLTPINNLAIYIRQLQAFEPDTKFQGLQSEIIIGQAGGTHLKVGVFYQYYRPNEIDNSFGFSFWASPKWRIDYDMKTTSDFNNQHFGINEHQFYIYRDLHCYNLGFTWRVRRDLYQGYTHETLFTFNLKLNKPVSRPANEDESIFYPWKDPQNN